MAKRECRVELYPDKAKQWRWRFIGGNGEIMFTGESHSRKSNAKRAAHRSMVVVRKLWQVPEIKEVDA